MGILLFSGVPASAEEAEALIEDRTYAPTDIVVTGQWSGYAADDGSTAMKTPTPLIDTPQSVSVVTRDQLDDQNVRQLGDALRYVAGISMESGEGHRDEIFIRGQETTADFFLNGLRDDSQYYRPLYNVERIEVLKGANALTFGRGGGGGIVNRVSRTADLAGTSVSGDASVDTFGAWALTAGVNQPFSDTVAGRIDATYEEFNSHRDYFDGRFFGVSPTITARLGENTRLIIGYSYDDDDRATDRGVPSTPNGLPLMGFDKTFFGDPDFNRAESQVHIARFRVDHDFTDSLSVNFTGQYANYDKLYANIVPGSINAANNTVNLSGYRDGTQRENWIGQGNLVWQRETGSINHTVLAGFEAMKQDSTNFRDVVRFNGGIASSVNVPLARMIDVPAFTLQLLNRNRASDLTVFAAYLQDQIELGEHLQLIAGIRYESFDLKTVDLTKPEALSRKDTKWGPRFGVVVKPQEDLSIYASYTQSFLPQSGDQFLLLSTTTDDLAPEKFENIELGVKWAIKPQLLFNAAIFQLTRSNSQTTDPTDNTLTILTGKSRTRGFEMSLAGDIADNWHVNLGYTYLDGKIRSKVGSAEPGTRLEQVPKHHIAAWTRYDITERFGVGAGIVHSSKQFTSLSNAVVLPAYTRVDLAAYFDVTENIGLQVNVDNLFDETYYPSAHGDNNIQPAKPLGASFSLRVRY